MAANVKPIFGLTPNVGPLNVLTGLSAGNVYDGNSANTVAAFTAGSNGAYIERIRFRAAGTNIQTVCRIFLNNGSAFTTAANNILLDEITLPATTASANAATALQELAVGFAVPAGYRIGVVCGTAVASGWYVTVTGMDY
jgi:hypothetical protein